MEAGKNSVIYMGLVPGSNKADNICWKTEVMGKMQQGSTVIIYFTTLVYWCHYNKGYGEDMKKFIRYTWLIHLSTGCQCDSKYECMK
jgi:hypothetical protein